MRQPAIYIMASRKNGTLYTGVTSNLSRRVHEHRQRLGDGFAARYSCTLLVYYELIETMFGAIAREKQIKAGSRAAKIRLIEARNSDWKDLYAELTWT